MTDDLGMREELIDARDLDRLIEMAWEDRTPFEAIEMQFGLKENKVREVMRRSLKSSSFKMWRKRVSGRKTRHIAKRGYVFGRFRSAMQRTR
ncbi:MAG: TIGR03643 family protein [Gammaproteobacteria bacterium]|jgi:uncharacterized protein (TIGR03643 family)|nr:TIGR03643 family protein [Gammaproteobacteria bacterium]|tara:strand:+ start:19091 stop:19366 length:276 start_codon:yes stop_codon:yes gene_type:complete